jgi:phosphoglycolate phosphatase
VNGPYELIVFDWDGTLMDSAARIVTCMQRAAADLAITVPEPAPVREIIGLGLAEAMARLFPGLPVPDHDRLVEAYRGHWLGSELPSSALFPGAVELVEGLHRRGLRLAVATGKSRRGLDSALAETGLGPWFPITRCADETFSKPHPQMLLEILTDWDTDPSAALVVGDTEYDMQMAANAGVAAVGVAHGVHAAERLLAHGALHCFDDLAQLASWLEGQTGLLEGVSQ